MKLESSSIIDRNVQDVFLLVRDQLDKIVPFLPNIAKVEVIEKVELDSGKKFRITNKWFAKAEIPSVAKKFIKPDIFCWKDCAIWDSEKLSVDYDLESFVAKDLFKASGRNTFKAISDSKCEILFSCNIQIFPDKIPGVPKFLANSAMPHLEKMIQNMLRPNLTMLGEGITRYYAGK